MDILYQTLKLDILTTNSEKRLMKVNDCNVFINDEKQTTTLNKGIESVEAILKDYTDCVTSPEVSESKLVLVTRFKDGTVCADSLEIVTGELMSVNRRQTTIERLSETNSLDVYNALANKMEISTNYQTFPSGEEERDIELIDTPCGVIIQVSD